MTEQEIRNVSFAKRVPAIYDAADDELTTYAAALAARNFINENPKADGTTIGGGVVKILYTEMAEGGAAVSVDDVEVSGDPGGGKRLYKLEFANGNRVSAGTFLDGFLTHARTKAIPRTDEEYQRMSESARSLADDSNQPPNSLQIAAGAKNWLETFDAQANTPKAAAETTEHPPTEHGHTPQGTHSDGTPITEPATDNPFHRQ